MGTGHTWAKYRVTQPERRMRAIKPFLPLGIAALPTGCVNSSSSPFAPPGTHGGAVNGGTVELAVPQGTTRTVTINCGPVPTVTPLICSKSNEAAAQNPDPNIIFVFPAGVTYTVSARTFTTGASHTTVTVPSTVAAGTRSTAFLGLTRTDVPAVPRPVAFVTTVTAPKPSDSLRRTPGSESVDAASTRLWRSKAFFQFVRGHKSGLLVGRGRPGAVTAAIQALGGDSPHSAALRPRNWSAGQLGRRPGSYVVVSGGVGRVAVSTGFPRNGSHAVYAQPCASNSRQPR
ncbi:hypothetical protein SAMN00790413_06542 [Deinococcus hopiensis KR-140]|uniref:Uncharacterized protein n=1 Tax=Deinococcus hopiensis KR-140 TaxID=695939 RepID=A0A1W1UAS6_9DEIO|nr:hypothetical protein SAMN00790413_06542 [Deinococcus hopiensis KR-140]